MLNNNSIILLLLQLITLTVSTAILLDGRTAHHTFDGIGGLSAGASSRLLYDYPEPQRSDILDLLFKPNHGASLQVLKVEVGGDAQSTDGSESSHMHTREEISCSRGYETWLISEAKARNSAIITYALSWAVPHWVGDGNGNGTGFHSPDNYVYQTKFLECVRNFTGYDIDVMGTWNEKEPGPSSYVSGLRSAFDAAGFSNTRISVYDGDYSVNNVVTAALADPVFNASFSSIGRHYPCDTQYPTVESDIHKALWSAEDLSTPNDWTGAACWGRLLNQNYVNMNMTSTISWSLIWSAIETLPFSGNGLMSAQQPWSGHYSGGDGSGFPVDNVTSSEALNGPLWTSAQTTQFTAPGWRYLHVPGGGSGFLPQSSGNGSYVTLVPQNDTSEMTIVIEKITSVTCKCNLNTSAYVSDGVVNFTVLPSGGLPGGATVLHVWRTNETVQFVQDADIIINSDGTFSVFVARDSIVTLSTLSSATHGVPSAPIPMTAPFPLPYADNFNTYPEDTTVVRYFGDQTGSFAVRQGALTQVVSIDPGSNRWTVEDLDPITLIGDHTLVDTIMTIAVTFEPALNASGRGLGDFGFTYVQACLRITKYTGFKNGPPPGYCLAVNASGAWLANAGTLVMASGQLPTPFDATTPHVLTLSAKGTVIVGSITGTFPHTTLNPPLFNVTNSLYSAGIGGLGSGFHTAAFDNFTIAQATAVPPF